MFIRLLAIVAFAFMPLAAFADDTTPPTDSTAAASSPSTSSPSTSDPQNATSGTGSMLGPSALNSTSGSGGSTGDSATLQPAGLSPLQSTNSDSNGLTAPNDSALQSPATSDQVLKVIGGDIDGAPVQVSDTSSSPSLGAWLGLSVLFGLIVTLLSLFYKQIMAAFRPLKNLAPARLRRRKRK